MSAFVDLSHELRDGMSPYPGLPDVHITAHLDHAASRPHYEGDDEFFLGKVSMPANVGTYLDSPFHRFSEREDLAGLSLDRLVGLDGRVVDGAGGERCLDPALPPGDLEGAAVLVRTGWDRRWGATAYWEPGPFLSEAFAERLVDARVALVGVDCWNVDDTATRRRPVHTALLGAGVLVVEHLCNLHELPSDGFRFFAPVLAVRGGASFPVRAFAEVLA